MKLLVYSSYYLPYTSGITKYTDRLVKHLGTNHDVDVLTFKHNQRLPKREKIGKITIRRLPYILKISKGFISPQSLITFFNQVRKSDTIFINLPNVEALPLAIIATILRKPIISIYHCEITLPKSFLKPLIQLVVAVSIFLQCVLSKKIIGYTKDYMDSLFIGRLFSEKIDYVLPPIIVAPVDHDYMSYIYKKNQIQIGFSGRIAHEKGIEHLIKAIQSLQEKKYIITLLIAGPFGSEVAGENAYYEYIKNLLEKSDFRYELLGNLSPEKLSAFYKTIDVLVLPSVNKTEAFGLVQAEAMLSGTPVVASNLPGVRVAIQLTKMGELAEVANVESIASKIEKIITNKKKYASSTLIRNAKKTFDPKKTFSFYDNLLLRINNISIRK